MDAKELMDIIPTRNIMVVGDVMLDEYLWGDIRRISPEAPVPIVEIGRQSYALGGAGNVAANLASLGSKVWLAGVVGADAQALKISEIFSQTPGIFTNLYTCHDRPTTTKTRIIAHSQQILRTDREERHPISAEAESNIIKFLQERLHSLHACILSDYAKGVLTEHLAGTLISTCKQANIPVIVDPKGHKYARYRGATIVTPNVAEAHLAAGNEAEELTLEQVAKRLHGDIGGGALLITQGAQGVTLFMPDSPPMHIAAQTRNIYDVTGAGDTVVAVLALLLAVGMDMTSAAKLANAAAGIVVGKVGTACVSLEELCDAL